VLYQLSYISPATTLRPCYREANPVSMIRAAKKTNNSNTTERTLPGSMVFTAKPQSTSSSAKDIHIRPGDRGPKSISQSW
jgi:hypothetical protein